MMISICALSLVLVIALALGVASWYLEASKLQRAADSAALAGAAGLPDQTVANDLAHTVFRTNGYDDAAYQYSVDAGTHEVIAKVTLKNANVGFLASLAPRPSITRTAAAVRSAGTPVMGSPFNVLGTGDLQVGNLPKQNFWLAQNGICQPKEDGDYFGAVQDRSKGPFLDPAIHGYAPGLGQYYKTAPNARMHCSHEFPAPLNPNYVKWGGYSYFVDVPKPPTVGGTVDIRIFDPVYEVGRGEAADAYIKLPKDPPPWMKMNAEVYDTNGTPDDLSDDVMVPGCPTRLFFWEYSSAQQVPTGRSTPQNWFLTCTIPYSSIVKIVKNPDGTTRELAGNTFRIQTQSPDDEWVLKDYSDAEIDVTPRGLNTYAVGAFASWIPEAGCDTRKNVLCPRVYARSSLSVDTVNVSTDATTVTPMYFAQVAAGAAGSQMKIYLWDPGENVQKIEVWGPGITPIPGAMTGADGVTPTGTRLPLTWTESNRDGGQIGGTSSGTSLDTTGKNSDPFDQWISNDYKYNDRLVTITLNLPGDWASLIESDPNKSDWVRLVYYTQGTLHDRTTWGMSGLSGVSSPPRLVR